MFDAHKTRIELVNWLREWFDVNGKDCPAVIGISGGKDSSVAAALCVEALGKDRVIGVMMPNGVQHDIKECELLAEHLGITLENINIKPMVIAFMSQIPHYPTDQATINLPPRIRMTMLYYIAQSIGGRVICTDNASESFVGYSTRWGDNVGDVAPLLDFTTDEVVAIGDDFGLPQELTHKVPSDGLCGLTDEDRFGFTYDQLNCYIKHGYCHGTAAQEKIKSMHEKNLFKTLPIPRFNHNRNI